MTPNTKSQKEQISYWPSRGTRVSSGLILSLFIHFKTIKEDYLLESDRWHNTGNKKYIQLLLHGV